jgi:hypothetical protein
MLTGPMKSSILTTDNDRFSIPEQAFTTGVLLVILLINYLVLVVADRIQLGSARQEST